MEERKRGKGGEGGFLGRGRISANAPHIIPLALLIPWNNKWKAVITARSYFPNDPAVWWKYGLCWLTQILRQGEKCIFIIWIQSYCSRYAICVCGEVGGGALKSIANMIPLSMSLAAHAFQTDLPKIQKFAKDCLSHQTAKYFSFYISIILFQTCVQTRNMN